ncbi:hypothetical protein SHIRM173S_10150 [Streptomyces hirsutus]
MVSDDDVDLSTNLMELGFDSISLTELITQVNARYGLDLLPTVLFEAPTLEALADRLVRDHPEVGRAPAPATPAVTDPAPVPTTRQQAPRPDPEPAPAPPSAPDGTTAMPIAVIGMAGRFPGVENLTALWDVVAAGQDRVGPVPARTGPNCSPILGCAGYAPDSWTASPSSTASRLRDLAARGRVHGPAATALAGGHLGGPAGRRPPPGRAGRHGHRSVRGRRHRRLQRADGVPGRRRGTHGHRSRPRRPRQPGLPPARPAWPQRGPGHRVLQFAGRRAPRGTGPAARRLRPGRRRGRQPDPEPRPLRHVHPGRHAQRTGPDLPPSTTPPTDTSAARVSGPWSSSRCTVRWRTATRYRP